MTVSVGVIGVGMIGKDHIRRLTTVLAGAAVVAVTDVNAEEAATVAAGLPGAIAHPTGQDVISDPAVDAVVVCSWGPTHEEYVLAAIAAGKPVFCEKPLATTEEACRRILDAESAFGRRLVQVGYMRRYDASYRALKAAVDSGEIGTPLMMHCTHRNPSVPGHYTKDMAITDTAVHEIDMVRWMFGEEIVATTVLTPRKSRLGGELQDPLLLLLEMEGGALIDVEISVNIRYGYDIRGEVVGEEGTAALGESNPIVVRKNNMYSGRVPQDWRERFLRAYDVEFQEWIDAVRDGGEFGPSAWDGYAAAVVSDAAVRSLFGGDGRVEVKLGDKPSLYDATT
ncbi:Gfo/Idh/MocA family protein [Nakamurella sp. PAMC28650]|uniref:Gfo/Idh/MocA family oxidoreductase n=1 Tax=Nakamurella sp. PAMC28650 TaxID=2762325 RepID=UPI00164E4D61|nr:Gfo/Idh/MocA family oxidoreductase [Nakamurella sp. PAMC28650]QNK81001.1 Gfo/Idh/MocA family oxidoreductase [Nakamurella sp. PAMC28650]